MHRTCENRGQHAPAWTQDPGRDIVWRGAQTAILQGFGQGYAAEHFDAITALYGIRRVRGFRGFRGFRAGRSCVDGAFFCAYKVWPTANYKKGPIDGCR